MWPQLMGWELGQVPDSLVYRSLEPGELRGRTAALLPTQPACAGPAEQSPLLQNTRTSSSAPVRELGLACFQVEM